MEKERFSVVDSWQSYATPACSAFIFLNSFTDSAAGVGKSILWYVTFSLFPQ